MRLIVMDKERSEPLTVVTIHERFMQEARQRRRMQIRFPVPASFRECLHQADQTVPELATVPIVTLTIEPIVTSDGNGGIRDLFWIAVPDSQDLALLLRAAFLPGQITEVRRRELAAWFAGALSR